jgi:hypothetical protein
MAKKPEPPKPTTWTIYKLAAWQERLGTVEAPDEAAAIERAAAEFGVKANRFVDGDTKMTRRSSLSADVIAQRSSIKCCACEHLICSVGMAHLQLTHRFGATHQR